MQALSVVTPVYNAAAYLQETYRSLRQQTFTCWEWVVVNDGSTDESGDILKSLAASDPRIHYYEQPNSGAAKQPRDRAVYHAKNEWVLFLDADDYLDANYLERMVARQKETEAQIVYGRMRLVGQPQKNDVLTLPTADIDTTRVYVGRDLIRETLPEFHIGCNGGLYHKSVWVNMSYPKKSAPIWMNSDEVDERLYLLQAKRVAFCEAIYYYRRHAESITIQFSPKLFQPLHTSEEVLDLVLKEFGGQSEEYLLAHKMMFATWRYLLSRYVKNFCELTDSAIHLFNEFSTAMNRLNPYLLTRWQRIKFLYLFNFTAIYTLFGLRYNPRAIYEWFYFRFFPNRYLLKITSKRTEAALKADIAKSYTSLKETGSTAVAGETGSTDVAVKAGKIDPCVVSVFNGNASGGGLVDRLRGIVSTFQICRALGLDYRIHFVHPFSLDDYLVPNTYDWQLPEDRLTFVREQVDIIVSDTLTDTPQERRQQRELIVQSLRQHPQLQRHVYTNTALSYDDNFAASFRQLFKPSPVLENQLQTIQEQIGGPYVSVSARFQNLFDDFNEQNYSPALNAEDQQDLLSRSLAQLEFIHELHLEHKVLLCSDSITFLEAASSLPYIYVIPGRVTHIDNDEPHDYAYYEKTFLDFFTISGAEKVYLLKESRMYSSGFPYAASLLGNKPFKKQLY